MNTKGKSAPGEAAMSNNGRGRSGLRGGPRMAMWISALTACGTVHAQLGLGRGGVAEMWANNCMRCHGEDAQGGGAGTRTLLIKDWRDPSLDRRYFDTIKSGKEDAGMEAFGQTMSDPQIWAMVHYIREKQYEAWRTEVGSTPSGEGAVVRTMHHAFTVRTVVGRGLDTPWSVEFAPDERGGGRMLIAERPGTLRTFDWSGPGGEISEPVAGVPAVRNRGQGGLMDIAVHPEFAQNGWIYLSYSDEQEREGRSAGMTKIVRGRLAGAGAGMRWIDQEVLWEARPEHYLTTDLHFGCRIVFERAATPREEAGKNGGRYYMYFAIGERGRMEHAQDLDRPNGKVHRVWDDGAVPSDNPFVGREGAYGSIWSYGHRNPQGLVFDQKGNLWDTEHGPRGGDELNRVMRGANYGWPVVSFGINYNGAPFKTPWADVSAPGDASAAEMVMPTALWSPSIGACGLTLAGPGGAFPGWAGDLLAGGLSGENVDRIRVAEDAGSPGGFKVVEREELIHGLGRVRDVVAAPDGTVFVVLNGPDKIVRLMPASE